MSDDTDFDLRAFLDANERGFTSHAQRMDLAMDTEEALRYQRLARLVDNINSDTRNFITRLVGAYYDAYNRVRSAGQDVTAGRETG
jgi:protein associated with RNAse G/E